MPSICRGGAGSQAGLWVPTSQGTEHQPVPAEMPGTPCPSWVWASLDQWYPQDGLWAAGSWLLALSEGTSCPRPDLRFTQSLPWAQFCAGAGGLIGGIREGLPSSGRSHRLLVRTPGLGQEGPFWRKRQQRSWAGGWGPGQRAFRPALCLQAVVGGRGAASSQMRRDHGPVFPECSGCQAQRVHSQSGA